MGIDLPNARLEGGRDDRRENREYLHIKMARLMGNRRANSLAFEPEGLSGLGPRWNLQAGDSFEGGNFDRRPEKKFGELDGTVQEKIVSLPTEERIGMDFVDHHPDHAGFWAGSSRHGKVHPLVHSRRDLDCDLVGRGSRCPRKENRSGGPKGRLPKGKVQVNLGEDRASPHASKKIPEVSEALLVKGAPSAPGGAGRSSPPRRPCPHGIVLFPLGRVGKNLIGLVDFLEALLGLPISRIDVGVELAGKLSLSLFDLLGRRLFRNSEFLVEILGHRVFSPYDPESGPETVPAFSTV